MKKSVLSVLLCAVLVLGFVLFNTAIPSMAAEELTPYVTDSTTTADEVLSAWSSGNYSYVKLGAGLELPMAGGEIIVDLAGNDLTVSGTGKVEVFDSANDTFDHTACGTLTVNDSVVYDGDCVAPNGLRYVALTDGNRSTIQWQIFGFRVLLH